MTTTELDAPTARRNGPRVSPPKLRISVVHKNLIGPDEHVFCELVDLSHSGIAIESQWLDAKVGEKLNLQIFDGARRYSSRGVITRVALPDNLKQFGIAFIYAPPELDRLIDIFVKDGTHGDTAGPSATTGTEKRQTGSRIATQDAQIYVKKTGSTEPYILCQVDNISQGGMGFYCPTKIDRKAPFDVSVQVSSSPKNTVITGRVHYMGMKSDGYYYGMEFELVSIEFARLLGQLLEPEPPQ